jgi:hypothetical protein
MKKELLFYYIFPWWNLFLPFRAIEISSANQIRVHKSFVGVAQQLLAYGYKRNNDFYIGDRHGPFCSLYISHSAPTLIPLL